MTDPLASRSWSFEIASSRRGALFSVALAWLFGLLVFGLFYVSGDNVPLGFALVISFGFSAVITYYGLKTAYMGAGRLRLDDAGFTIARGGSDERHAWADVERFYVDRFGASPVYEGRLVPHFRLKSGVVSWLPDNLGLVAPDLVTAMERFRQLAGRGWPHRPGSIAAALGDDFDTVIDAEFLAPPKRDPASEA